jgi:anaerobic selenocysteine-containing dehydrogenase
VETIFRACTLCEAHCGLAFQRDGETLLSVRGDPDDVYSHGYVCPKGIAIKDLHCDADRLRGPVRRTPAGHFEPIGWDEALDMATSGLRRAKRERGPKAIGLFGGNPLVHNPGALLGRAGLARAIGLHNVFGTSSQDTSPRFATSYYLYGSSFVVPVPDLERTAYLLCLGANPVVSNGSFLTAPDMRGRLRSIRKRGGRIVVVDPRLSETAREADEHVSVLPGGDAALILGMLRVLVDEGRTDRPAIARLARGWDAVQRIVAKLSLGDLSNACGVAEDTIARLARDFVAAHSSVAYCRTGITNTRFGTLATYAADLLNVAAGRLGAEGGALFARPALDITRISRLPGMDGHGRWRSRVRGLPETVGELPGSCLAEEIESQGDGQIHALVTHAANPVLSTPNGQRLDRALARLDFMVAIDPYVNETTRHAHVILPPASSLTEEHLDFFFAAFSLRNVTRLSPPAVDPRPDDMPDWKIMWALAEGLGGGFTGIRVIDAALLLARRTGFDVTPTVLLAALLRSGPHGDHFLPLSRGLNLEKLRRAPHGVDLGPLRPGVRDRVLHRDGRIRLDAPPLLAALESYAGCVPRGPSSGELLLIGRREVRSNNSWMHNLPSLVRGRERCVLFVHPDDARAAGLRDGDMGWLQSRVHSGPVPVRLNDEMRRGVVSLPHGWGHAKVAPFQRTAGERPGVSANDWTDEAEVESVVGQSILNGVPVRLGRLPSKAAHLEAVT